MSAQFMMSGELEYSPLPPDGTIRLIILHAGAPNDSLRCSFSLTQLSAPTPYEAVSYAWGSGDCAHTVTSLTGKTSLAVPASCHAALRAIRTVHQSQYVWIDSICVNQDDLIEKASQVSMMGKIYTCAVSTLVYLGEDDGTFAALVQALRTARETFKHLPKAFDKNGDHPPSARAMALGMQLGMTRHLKSVKFYGVAPSARPQDYATKMLQSTRRPEVSDSARRASDPNLATGTSRSTSAATTSNRNRFGTAPTNYAGNDGDDVSDEDYDMPDVEQYFDEMQSDMNTQGQYGDGRGAYATEDDESIGNDEIGEVPARLLSAMELLNDYDPTTLDYVVTVAYLANEMDYFCQDLFLPLRRFHKSLFGRAWFTRLWVIQEVALSKNVRIYLGRQSANWGTVMALYNLVDFRFHQSKQSYFGHPLVCDRSMLGHHIGETFMQINGKTLTGYDFGGERLVLRHRNAFHDEDESHYHQSSWPFSQDLLLDLLYDMRLYGCKDGRDRLFAILSIVDGAIPEALRPNYDPALTEANVFARIIKHQIDCGRFDALSYASPLHGVRSRMLGLATWATDWNQPPDRRLAINSAALHTKMTVGTKSDMPPMRSIRSGPGNEIVLRGMVFDEITYVGKTCPPNPTESEFIIMYSCWIWTKKYVHSPELGSKVHYWLTSKKLPRDFYTPYDGLDYLEADPLSLLPKSISAKEMQDRQRQRSRCTDCYHGWYSDEQSDQVCSKCQSRSVRPASPPFEAREAAFVEMEGHSKASLREICGGRAFATVGSSGDEDPEKIELYEEYLSEPYMPLDDSDDGYDRDEDDEEFEAEGRDVRDSLGRPAPRDPSHVPEEFEGGLEPLEPYLYDDFDQSEERNEPEEFDPSKERRTKKWHPSKTRCLVPDGTREGDLVCGLLGCEVAVILRPHGKRFLFVGTTTCWKYTIAREAPHLDWSNLLSDVPQTPLRDFRII